MSCKHIVSPIVFDTTMTAEVYHDIIQQFIEHNAVFQQDNVRDTMSFLAEFFEKLIASGLT